MRKKSSNWITRALIGLGGAFVTVWLAFIALGHYFARRIVTPESPDEPLRIVAVNRTRVPHSVTLTRGTDVDLPGSHYSLVFAGGRGHAKIGHILRQDARHVERELIAIDRGEVTVGVRGRLGSWWWSHPDELEGTWREIEVPGELGTLPVWRIDPQQDDDTNARDARTQRVAIHVHGRGGAREETLRGVRVLQRLGYTNLVMKYRNDPGAPTSPDGRYGLGTTEWRDVDAVMQMARQQGATELVLFGWSMGATIVLVAARESEHRDLITHLILESPAVSWPDILDHHGKLARVPKTARRVGERAIATASPLTSLQEAIAVDLLTPEVFAATLEHRTLILASEADTFVPQGPAFALAELRPDLVTLERFDVGEHVKLWNVEPERWERAVHTFLSD